MIYTDIDGVLRDLCGAAGINPTEYDCTVGAEKIPLIEFFSKNLMLLSTAKPTKYFDVIQMYHRYIRSITILSAQLNTWKEPTITWLNKHFKSSPVAIFTFDKLFYLGKNDILIEDSPNLSDYSQVILIDQLYNRKIKLPHVRVETPKQLLNEIFRSQHGFTL